MSSHALRTTARVVALVASAGLVVSGGAVATASSDGDAANQKARKGTLDWGVKESFRDYVEGPIADGGIEMLAPAKRRNDGTFTWVRGKGKVNTDTDTLNLKVKGGVYFYGHDDGTGPQLEVTLKQVRLVIDGDDSVLVADVTSRLMGDPEFYDNVELVTVDASGLDLESNGGVVRASDLATELTEEGAQAFAGFYPEGTAFDSLSFKVRVRG